MLVATQKKNTVAWYGNSPQNEDHVGLGTVQTDETSLPARGCKKKVQ